MRILWLFHFRTRFSHSNPFYYSGGAAQKRLLRLWCLQIIPISKYPKMIYTAVKLYRFRFTNFNEESRSLILNLLLVFCKSVAFGGWSLWFIFSARCCKRSLYPTTQWSDFLSAPTEIVRAFVIIFLSSSTGLFSAPALCYEWLQIVRR